MHCLLHVVPHLMNVYHRLFLNVEVGLLFVCLFVCLFVSFLPARRLTNVLGEIKFIYKNAHHYNTTIWRRFALTYRYGIGIVEFNVPLDTV